MAVFKRLRATFISAVALPLSIIPAFGAWTIWVFPEWGHLAGVILVVGILVDDAIVEVENIVRHLHMGKTPIRRR